MRLFCIVFLIAYCLPGYSQKNKPALPVISLRTIPSSFLEVDAGATLGIGVQVAPRWELTFDPMLIFYAPFEMGENYEDRNTVNGYKLRTALKYYLRDYEYGRKPKLFFAFEWHHKNVTEKKWSDFGMNGVNGQYSFFQRARYDEIRVENGGIVKTGCITRLWSPRWAMEVFAGIGVKHKRQRQSNIPAGGEFLGDPNSDNIFISETGTLPMMPIGAKFLFRIY